MDSSALFNEIESAFPETKMPAKAAISFHKNDYPQCEYLGSYLEECRAKEITGNVIRYCHQELGCLSTVGLKWFLPHYLKSCLTPEAEYNQSLCGFLAWP
jgi:hypothetical protein